MVDKINAGGPAFPFIAWRSPDGMVGMERTNGMSLRDWFAGQAMAATMSEWSDAKTRSTYAKRAYLMADALLAARNGEL